MSNDEIVERRPFLDSKLRSVMSDDSFRVTRAALLFQFSVSKFGTCSVSNYVDFKFSPAECTLTMYN